MTDSKRATTIDALLEHASWVGGLARSLVGPDRADDLAQDVWVSALRRPPGREGSLRGWLRRVLVQRARQDHRGNTRRDDRERDVASQEEVDDPLDRFCMHRDLVQLVGELEDPWRKTLLWRYFDELSLKEIATRSGVPVPTVNTRLRKAKELLKGKLDDAHDGDRRAWMLALAPLAHEFQPLAPLTPAALTGIGAPLIAMKLPQVLAAVAAASVAAYFILPGDDSTPLGPRAAEKPAAVEAEDLAPVAHKEPVAPRAQESAREAVANDRGEPVHVAQEDVPAILTGKVIDTEGRTMPGLEVWFSSDSEERLLGVSAADGSFDLDPSRDIGLIEVRDDVWGSALSCRLPAGFSSAPTLVVARWIEFSGIVRNEEGEFIERAQLNVMQPVSLRASVSDRHDSSVSHEPMEHSDEFGAFHFEKALAVEGSQLLIQAQGYSDSQIDLPLVATHSLEITLRRPEATRDAVIGQVVDGAGIPVPDAWVSLGYLSVQTDDSGAFRLNTGREGKFDRLVAVKAGYLPAIIERETNVATGEKEPWPDFVSLPLGDTPLDLAGRVVDSRGVPLANWKVWLKDPTFFSLIDQRGVMTEGLALDLLEARDEESEPTAAWPWALTDDQGRFELGGLQDREYSLRVLHASSLLMVDAGPYRAGRRDLEIVLDLDELYGPIEGRITSANGDPLEGVTVDRWVMTYTSPHGESGMLFWSEDGAGAVTDADGRYRFERLPRDGVTLHVKHPDILPEEFRLARDEHGGPRERDDWKSIDFVCKHRFHVQVEIDPGLATSGSISLLNAAGEETLIQVFSAGGHMSTGRYHFQTEKTEVMSVSGDVREVVIRDEEGAELGRQSVELEFGELNSIEF